jgi:hypothetical protein
MNFEILRNGDMKLRAITSNDLRHIADIIDNPEIPDDMQIRDYIVNGNIAIIVIS